MTDEFKRLIVNWVRSSDLLPVVTKIALVFDRTEVSVHGSWSRHQYASGLDELFAKCGAIPIDDQRTLNSFMFRHAFIWSGEAATKPGCIVSATAEYMRAMPAFSEVDPEICAAVAVAPDPKPRTVFELAEAPTPARNASI